MPAGQGSDNVELISVGNDVLMFLKCCSLRIAPAYLDCVMYVK